MLIGGTKLGDWWYRESLLLSLTEKLLKKDQKTPKDDLRSSY